MKLNKTEIEIIVMLIGKLRFENVTDEQMLILAELRKKLVEEYKCVSNNLSNTSKKTK